MHRQMAASGVMPLRGTIPDSVKRLLRNMLNAPVASLRAGVQCSWDDWVDYTAAGPRARHGHSMVWDAEKQAALIFGGEAGRSFDYFQDLWQYHWPSRAWTLLSASGPSTRPALTQEFSNVNSPKGLATALEGA